jgi:hypothetical protein
MSYKLTIKNPDNSVYWVEHFKTEAEKNKWLAEEQTRPYWNPSFTTEVEVLTNPTPTQQEIDQQEALKYLASTDWYIIREMDSGVPCPAEIKQLRQAARLKV